MVNNPHYLFDPSIDGFKSSSKNCGKFVAMLRRNQRKMAADRSKSKMKDHNPRSVPQVPRPAIPLNPRHPSLLSRCWHDHTFPPTHNNGKGAC